MTVITFGEIMLRLTPPGCQRFVQAQQFDVTFGGGEANVAVALANYGLDSHFVTKVPAHEIGQAAVNHLRRFGVQTEGIVRGGERLGVYFLEMGASQRGAKVLYDRAHSAIHTLTPAELDWDTLFARADWFHWTGITAALGEGPRRVLRTACEAARRHGVTVSCDLNFRKKLWTAEEARTTMRPLMAYVDVCIANEEDADRCLGLQAEHTKVDEAQLDEAGFATLAQQLKQTFGFQTVAITLRESYSASVNGWRAVLHDDQDAATPYFSRRYEITLVDRVGGGDAFASGLIYGLHHYANTCEALEFAVAASCLKQTIPGDFNHVSVAEVESLMAGSGSGRVER